MKKIIVALLFVIASHTAYSQTISSLAFMTGCWSTIDEDGNKVTEDWFKPTQNNILGVSQSKNKDNSMIEHGFLDIQQELPNQEIIYSTNFPGHSPASLTLSSVKILSSDYATAVFSNPEGVVKKMTYTLKSKNFLNIRYEGKGKDGQNFDFFYDFKREECNGRF